MILDSRKLIICQISNQTYSTAWNRHFKTLLEMLQALEEINMAESQVVELNYNKMIFNKHKCLLWMCSERQFRKIKKEHKKEVHLTYLVKIMSTMMVRMMKEPYQVVNQKIMKFQLSPKNLSKDLELHQSQPLQMIQTS